MTLRFFAGAFCGLSWGSEGDAALAALLIGAALLGLADAAERRGR